MKRALGALLVSLLFVGGAAGGPRQFLVSRVVDGDTVVLSNDERVRLIGVDCEEMAAQTEEQRSKAKAAREFVRAITKGKQVRLEYDRRRTDRYGRTLAYVFAGDLFVNAEIVKQGYCRALLKYPFSRLKEFRGYESAARAKAIAKKAAK